VKLNRLTWLVLTIAALAIAASLSGLGNGFVYDDQAIIVGNEHVHTLAGLGHRFVEPYWPADRGAGLYRPLTIVLFALEWAIGGGTPFIFHLTNILLYGLLSGLVFLLARRLLSESAAWVSAALFAVHPVHVEAVANGVGQAELTTACAMIGAVLVYLRGCARTGPPLISGRALAGVLALYLVACLSKEHGVILPAILLAGELTVRMDSTRWPTRMRGLLQPYALLAVVGGLYLMARTLVLARIPADIQALSFQNLTAGQRVMTSLALVPDWLRLLFWPAHLQADYSPQETAVITGFQPAVAVGALLLIAFALGALLLRRRMPVVTFAVGWTAIALLPVSNLVVPTGQVLAERTMLLPSVGAVLLVGALFAFAADRWQAPVARQVGKGVVAALVLVGLMLSALRQPVWATDAGLRAQTVLDAPRSYWAHWMYGDWLFTHGRPAEGERHMRLAVELYRDNPFILRTLAIRYQDNGFCRAAAPLYERTLALRPLWWEVRLRLGTCLRSLGQPVRGDSVVGAGLGLGPGDSALRHFRAQPGSIPADSARR
jgi:hypothetical protein